MVSVIINAKFDNTPPPQPQPPQQTPPQQPPQPEQTPPTPEEENIT